MRSQVLGCNYVCWWKATLEVSQLHRQATCNQLLTSRAFRGCCMRNSVLLPFSRSQSRLQLRRLQALTVLGGSVWALSALQSADSGHHHTQKNGNQRGCLYHSGA